jgi:hypothetical protein
MNYFWNEKLMEEAVGDSWFWYPFLGGKEEG